ncbi:MAG: pyridoxamine 5'-phosphate oxidase family protein [Desulfobacula sp.]|jgi:uncharacterized protein|nr:pyridoxamine 5'-phosphate oxidase family protein [Desulfobacula sp.]MBT5546206.1 pyridoxamine 5'-phosphate oxidase family protein [Desulfobacula sp.]MBT7713038.1 pyridoxamine 5'-phosphate oxidase family protein [Deltaproteobacteria bacterium]
MENKKSLLDLEKIEALIKDSIVCRLGINQDKTPYIVPLSFGYRDNTLYFHSGHKGNKLDLLRADPNVCFEFDRVTEVIEAQDPCSWNMMYQSIIGIGKVAFIDETENKIKALKTIISQYSDRQMDIPQVKAKAAVVFQVNIENMTFKQGPV